METLYRKGAGEPDPFLETFLRGMETLEWVIITIDFIYLETFLRGMETVKGSGILLHGGRLETFLRGMETGQVSVQNGQRCAP